MGRSRGDLKRWPALALPFLLAVPGVSRADEAPSAVPAVAAQPGEIDAQDLALLRELDLVLDWELIQDWDPVEDLPIPMLPVPAGGTTREDGEPEP
ncbi:MAG: hypothetical protein HRU00_03690 [Myxococcales bacterium]|nr:hypothetical protein [Myxococcales bacterium]